MAEGWASVLYDFFIFSFSLAKKISLIHYLFLFFNTFSAVIAMFPWVRYNVNFLISETESIGSTARFLLVLPMPIAFAAWLIPGKYKIWIYYVPVSLIGCMYAAGLFYFNPIHTKMINPADYTILNWTYYYGIAIAASLASAYTALKNETISYDFLFKPVENNLHIKNDSLNFMQPRKISAENVHLNPKKDVSKQTSLNSEKNKSSSSKRKNLNIKIVKR